VRLIVRHDGEQIEAVVERHGGGYSVRLGEKSFDVDLESANRLMRSLRFEDGRQYLIGHHAEKAKHHISFGDKTVMVEVFDPLTMKRSRGDDDAGAAEGSIRALMPGRVVRLLVEEGAEVTKGKGLLILEAMKMENEIAAPRDCVVSKIIVQAGETVEGGAELLLIE
jgi:biotin carboxyl carrier protein